MMDSEKKTKGKGRGRGRGRGRPKGSTKKIGKKVKERDDSPVDVLLSSNIEKENESGDENEDIMGFKATPMSPNFSGVASLSSPPLSSPSISFVNSSSTPLHKSKPLSWHYKVNLIGLKVMNPRIDFCEKCNLPILVYGRLIPCKHVYCYACSKQYNEGTCLRCNEKVIRIEQSRIGSVFMCQNDDCRRTYLSERDLQAHIQHRHVRRTNPSTSTPSQSSLTTSFNHSLVTSYQTPITVVSSRSNLISIPISAVQDEVLTPQSPMCASNQATTNFSPQAPSQFMQSWHSPHAQFPYRQSNWPTVTPTPPPPFNPYNRPYGPYS